MSASAVGPSRVCNGLNVGIEPLKVQPVSTIQLPSEYSYFGSTCRFLLPVVVGGIVVVVTVSPDVDVAVAVAVVVEGGKGNDEEEGGETESKVSIARDFSN